MRAVYGLVLCSIVGWGQVAQEANREYQTREGRDRMVGILESPQRLANLRVSELVRQLNVQPGSTVADIGTGTGALLSELSRAVGPNGRVLAEDIHDDFLDRARGRAREAGLKNVQFILGSETDPQLPEGSTDLAVVLDAYHHFNYPDRMLAAIKRQLKPGGRLAIIEYHKRRGAMEADPDMALTHIRAGADQMMREVKGAGYSLLWEREYTPGKQYIAMFGAK